MYGRQNNNFFSQQNAVPIEENATSSRISGGEHRVVRSEVWNRFRLEGLNAICLVCNEKLKVGPTRQTSSLWRHLKRHNRMPAQNHRLPSAGGYHLVHPQSQLYLQQQQQMRRSANAFALSGDGVIHQQQKGAIPSHASRGLPLHHLRLQQQHQQQALRAAPTALLHNNFHNPHNQSQQQQYSYRHLPPFSSSASTPFNHHHQQQSVSSPSPSAVEIPLTHPPMVTVDCKPVQNRELDQLLGIRREEEEEEEQQQQQQEYEGTNSSKRGTEQDDESIMLNEDDDRGDEEEGNNGTMMEEEEEEEEDDEEGHNEQRTTGTEWELAQTLSEFILENALSFHRLLLLSPTFSSLLHINQSKPKCLPSPAFLLQRVVPKLFVDTLEERKKHFNNEFFVLVLSKIELSSPKQTALLCVTAQKLSDCFSLCSQSLGQFAFDCSDPSGMSNALRHCFEMGPVRLHLWQISAIVHDGDADFEELCHQLDVPGMPSFYYLMRRTYAELDRLEFPPEIVTPLKKRFEKAVEENLNDNHLHADAFSVLIPTLVDRIDRFLQEEQNAVNGTDDNQEETEANVEEKNYGSAPIPIRRLEQRLLNKLQLMWTFQRRKLVEMETARMALFLNPSNLCVTKRAEERQEEFFGESTWHKTAEMVREQIRQACENGEDTFVDEAKSGESDGVVTKTTRDDIQSEVTNYMDTARLELGHPSTSNNSADPSSALSPSLSARFLSLAELLFWWRINAERFPRLVQLARQFCAIPMDNRGDQWSGMSKGDDNDDEERKITRRYADELIAKDGDTTRLESGRTEQLQLLTQLMTVRMALRERTTKANGTGEEFNEFTTTNEEASGSNAQDDDHLSYTK